MLTLCYINDDLQITLTAWRREKRTYSLFGEESGVTRDASWAVFGGEQCHQQKIKITDRKCLWWPDPVAVTGAGATWDPWSMNVPGVWSRRVRAVLSLPSSQWRFNPRRWPQWRRCGRKEGEKGNALFGRGGNVTAANFFSALLSFAKLHSNR